MLTHPGFDPVAFSFWKISLHWYGVMYLLGFVFAYLLVIHFIKKGKTLITKEQLDDGLFIAALCLIFGGRIGYVFFYAFDRFLAEPLWLFKLSDGGMSFHGGFLGIVLAIFIFCWKYKLPVGSVADTVAVSAPMGLFFGRIGNFIGQELWGRETDVPWGMVFPNDPLGLVRHPSQLYEAFSEGILIFIILLWYTRKPRPEWSTGALFVLLYGIFRFLIEFFRMPDIQIGFDLFGWMTRGQILCSAMILVGGSVFAWSWSRQNPPLSGVASTKPGSGKAAKPKKQKKK